MFLARSNLLRAGYHIQVLAFTAHLSVPQVSIGYRQIAQRFSWATLTLDQKVSRARDRTALCHDMRAVAMVV